MIAQDTLRLLADHATAPFDSADIFFATAELISWSSEAHEPAHVDGLHPPAVADRQVDGKREPRQEQRAAHGRPGAVDLGAVHDEAHEPERPELELAFVG